MTELDAFWAEMLPRYTQAVDGLHNGDPAPFASLWTRSDPISLLGAGGVSISGWENVANAQAVVASRFSTGTAVAIELIAGDVHGDLAYTVGYERSSVSVAGAPAQPAVLRATQIYRRENGDWKLAHRHADPVDSPATEAFKEALKADSTTPRGDR